MIEIMVIACMPFHLRLYEVWMHMTVDIKIVVENKQCIAHCLFIKKNVSAYLLTHLSLMNISTHFLFLVSITE